MAGITILFLPLLIPLTFALSPVLLFGGLLWAVFKRSQPHIEHCQTSGAEQVQALNAAAVAPSAACS